MKAADLKEVTDLLAELKQYDDILAYYKAWEGHIENRIAYSYNSEEAGIPHPDVYNRFLNESKEAITEFVIKEITDAKKRTVKALAELGVQI